MRKLITCIYKFIMSRNAKWVFLNFQFPRTKLENDNIVSMSAWPGFILHS